jgi:hypothetical protein
LIFCPREVCFRRLNPILENKNQDRFLLGRLLTIQFQEILLARYPRQFEIEKQIHYNLTNYCGDVGQGCTIYVLGKIDAFNKKTGPYEFKTIYSVEKIRKPRRYDLQQLKFYMTMTNSNTGVLWYYQLDSKFADCRSVKFSIKMSEDDLYFEHNKLVLSAMSLSEAISAEKPEMAEHVAYDRELMWKCKSCTYSRDCKAIRLNANGFRLRAVE